MATLDNCNLCGKIFARTIHLACPACTKSIDDQFEACYKVLKKNPNMQTEELSEISKVPVTQILEFIKQGKFVRTGFKHLAAQCSSCKGPSNGENLCNKCKKSFLDVIKKEIKISAPIEKNPKGVFLSSHHRKNRDN